MPQQALIDLITQNLTQHSSSDRITGAELREVMYTLVNDLYGEFLTESEINTIVSGLQTEISNKVDKVTGKGLSTNDFTDLLKAKLDAITGTNTGDETQSSILAKLGYTPENVANKVSSFSATPDNINYATEKLVKDSLDLKENLSNKVSSFGATPNNTNYPTEKLVKDSLDTKQNNLAFVTETQNTFLRDDNTFQKIETAVGGYANNLYYTETSSDVPTYETLSYTPQLAPFTESISVTSSDGIKLYRNYIYPSAVSVDLMPAGVWSFTFYGKVSNNNGITRLGVTYFARHTNGTETDLFTLWSNEINNTSDDWIKFESTQPDYTIATTDRMGARIKAQTTSNQTITLTYAVGNGYGAWLNNPNKIRHSQLRALNEDTTNQHVSLSAKTFSENVYENTFKTTPIDTDRFLIRDTADSNKWKEVTKLNTDEVYIGTTAPLNNQKLWVDTSVQSSATYVLRTEIGDRHGFILPPNTSNFTFDNSTRTFVLLTNAGDFKINGATFLINSVPLANRTIQIGTGLGQHFIWLYLNNGVPTLQTSQTAWNIMDLTVIPVATVHWDGATGIVGDELHQASRNLIEHQKQHDTDGCRWVSGGATTFGDSQNNNFSSSVAVVRDEDRYHTIAAKTTAQIGYRVSGGATMTFDTAGTAVCKLNGNVVRYDNGGTLTDVTSGNYVGYYMYFTNRKATTGATSPEIVFIMGQAQYGSIASLQAGAQPTLVGISVAEWKLAYRVIFRQSGSQFVYVQADDLRSTTTGLAVSGGGVSNDPSKASKSTFTSDSSTSGTINIAINETRYLSTTLTNSHTITITPLKPVSVSETLVSSIIFKVGASAPSITITPDSGVTHTWMNTAPSSFTINKANEITFVWISTTECLVYSKEQS